MSHLVIKRWEQFAEQEVERFTKVATQKYQRDLKLDRLNWWREKKAVPKALRVKGPNAQAIGEQRLMEEISQLTENCREQVECKQAMLAAQNNVNIYIEKDLNIFWEDLKHVIGGSPELTDHGGWLEVSETGKRIKKETLKKLEVAVLDCIIKYREYRQKDLEKLEKQWEKEQAKQDVDMEYVDVTADTPITKIEKKMEKMEKEFKAFQKNSSSPSRIAQNPRNPQGRYEGRGANSGKGKRDDKRSRSKTRSGSRNRNRSRSRTKTKPNTPQRK